MAMLISQTKRRSSQSSTGGLSSRSYTPMAEINVTPFVDVMLVLLIVFMVSAPLLTSGVPVDLPQSQAGPLNENDNQPIELTLNAGGEIFIGESRVKRERLLGLIQAITEKNLDRRIYIRADQDLAYGRVAQILGQLNRAGYQRVALISVPDN